MRNSHIEIRPIAGALGAEVGGVDVAEDLDEAVIGEIRQALLDYGVIFFRDQKLDIVRHKAFTRRFGGIFIHPNYKGVSADPEIVDIRREPGDQRLLARIGIPTLPWWRSRRWAPSSMPSMYHLMAEIHCLPASISPTKACRTV